MKVDGVKKINTFQSPKRRISSSKPGLIESIWAFWWAIKALPMLS